MAWALFSCDKPSSLLAHAHWGMGMPIGAEVRIIQHKGAGVVLANGHGRIALGSSAAQLVYVELVDDETGCTAERCAAFAETNAKLASFRGA